MPTKLDRDVLDENRFAIVEWEPELHIPEDEIFRLSDGKEVIPYRKLQRIIGAVKGTVIEYREDDGSGLLEVQDHEFPFIDQQEDYHSRRLLADLLASGDPNGFSFWPSHSDSGQPIPVNVEELKVSWIWTNPIEIDGYVDTFGKLLHIGRHGFRVGIISPSTEKRFYVDFAGEYPYPDEEGDYVFVRGTFHPASGNIQFEETRSIAFARGDRHQEALEKMSSD